VNTCNCEKKKLKTTYKRKRIIYNRNDVVPLKVSHMTSFGGELSTLVVVWNDMMSGVLLSEILDSVVSTLVLTIYQTIKPSSFSLFCFDNMYHLREVPCLNVAIKMLSHPKLYKLH
jgi:hypothetical protein